VFGQDVAHEAVPAQAIELLIPEDTGVRGGLPGGIVHKQQIRSQVTALDVAVVVGQVFD